MKNDFEVLSVKEKQFCKDTYNNTVAGVLDVPVPYGDDIDLLNLEVKGLIMNLGIPKGHHHSCYVTTIEFNNNINSGVIELP